MKRIDRLIVQVVITEYNDEGRPIAEVVEPPQTVFIATHDIYARVQQFNDEQS